MNVSNKEDLDRQKRFCNLVNFVPGGKRGLFHLHISTIRILDNWTGNFVNFFEYRLPSSNSYMPAASFCGDTIRKSF